ncbi:hypothetical protein D9756_009079 [Leucocoprinus leucothites]|uniref:AB hydrolase-1 domain-containing protein n=1 Tax=Leucocoprinus leucothites TaxID=201217 RepID=A0A8H5CZP6_9AGAR|nr:hypothetical protein D9756_009079 [Leucoagaricus leucothites]
MAIDYSTKYEARFVKSADGTEIYTDAAGNRSPSAPIIVLIHGGSMVKESYDPIFEDPRWTSRAFLVRYDARGHGRSGKPLTHEGWDSQRIWEDFEVVCTEFEVQEAYILGWSLGSAHFVDILTYNTSITISGLINVAGAVVLVPGMFKSPPSYTPEAHEILTTLARPPSVDDFQVTVFRFINICSEKLSPNLARILLEGIMLQPRRCAISMNARTHDPTKMLQEAREGRLKLLVIGGGKDKTLNVEGFKALLDETGWKEYTYRHLEEADHMPWVSQPDAFRDIVLGWISRRIS